MSMEVIKPATSKQIAVQITHAVEQVASWPLWKANPDVILWARQQRHNKDKQT